MDILINLTFRLKVYLFRLIVGYQLIGMKTAQDENILIPSREASRSILAHIYRPKEAATPSRSPVLINLHGSGFIIPGHGTDSPFCRYISDNSSFVVIDVRYRLSPENPFPAPLDDLEDVVKWVLGQPDTYDISRIALSGFSAGANLTAAAIGCLFPKDTFHAYISFYPLTDFSIRPEDRIAPDLGGTPIPASAFKVFNWAYLPKGIEYTDPRISPAFSALDRFPDTLIVTAAFDSLAKEAEDMGAAIQAIPGHDVVVKRMEKCAHAFDKGAKEGTVQAVARDETYLAALELLKR